MKWPGRCAAIRVKELGRAGDPHRPGTGSYEKESAYEQLCRYVEAESASEQITLDDNDTNADQKWIGIVTDSRVWWVWEWNPTPQYVLGWRGTRLDATNLQRLESLLQSRQLVGREPAPDDPTGLFKPHLEELHKAYKLAADERDVVTQRSLWFRQLKLSGNQPGDEHRDELFVLHTLMIAVASKIAKLYDTRVRHGFASWVKGTDWLRSLEDTVKRYNWGAQTGDVLRALYIGLVDRKHRHIYGEYYTPDWVAEKLCSEIIDDEWIHEWVSGRQPGGLMDPACGSGTFLYHAVRHIVQSRPVRRATMNARQKTDMVVRMVYGIDIHPVAVAMAKANVLRALPDRPSEPLRIYQGDSLQIARSTEANERLDEEGRVFIITSRNNQKMRFPLEFVMSDKFDANMRRLARAAVRGNPFPPGLDGGLEPVRAAVLRKTFDVLTRVCREEGNDVWAWYTINQAGIHKLGGQISRMVANPPWVRLSNIQDRPRKDGVERLARKLHLWVGGKNATGFNMAALFVAQCAKIYGTESLVSGWVLPDAAMRGGNWAGYVKAVKPPVVWDLGGLPFPKHAKCCINILGTDRRPPVRLEMNRGERPPAQRDGWGDVESKATFVKVTRHESVRSAWFDGKRPVARQGAILTPSCLVVLADHTIREGEVTGTTAKSIHGRWRGRSFRVRVPQAWVHQVLFNKEGLRPYRIGTPRNVILPIDEKGGFLAGRRDTKWWRDAADKYRAHRGAGAATPKTLEGQLDFGGKLRNQFPIRGNIVLYNASGSNLAAARMAMKYVVDSSLYRVRAGSAGEALFLVGILNADCMAERFRATRKSDRHFHTHLWREVPIPRFDGSDSDHARLAELALRAERVAAGAEPTYKSIKEALADDGVAADIDRVVARVITKAAESVG